MRHQTCLSRLLSIRVVELAFFACRYSSDMSKACAFTRRHTMVPRHKDSLAKIILKALTLSKSALRMNLPCEDDGAPQKSTQDYVTCSQSTSQLLPDRSQQQAHLFQRLFSASFTWIVNRTRTICCPLCRISSKERVFIKQPTQGRNKFTKLQKVSSKSALSWTSANRTAIVDPLASQLELLKPTAETDHMIHLILLRDLTVLTVTCLLWDDQSRRNDAACKAWPI